MSSLANWSLSGELRPVRCALATAMTRGHARAAAVRLALPQPSDPEAALVPATQVYARGT